MSDALNAKIEAIDALLRENPNLPETRRTKIETLRGKFLEHQENSRQILEKAFEDQNRIREESAKRRERAEETKRLFAEFNEAWLKEVRSQANLMQRIADKL